MTCFYLLVLNIVTSVSIYEYSVFYNLINSLIVTSYLVKHTYNVHTIRSRNIYNIEESIEWFFSSFHRKFFTNNIRYTINFRNGYIACITNNNNYYYVLVVFYNNELKNNKTIHRILFFLQNYSTKCFPQKTFSLIVRILLSIVINKPTFIYKFYIQSEYVTQAIFLNVHVWIVWK